MDYFCFSAHPSNSADFAHETPTKSFVSRIRGSYVLALDNGGPQDFARAISIFESANGGPPDLETPRNELKSPLRGDSDPEAVPRDPSRLEDFVRQDTPSPRDLNGPSGHHQLRSPSNKRMSTPGKLPNTHSSTPPRSPPSSKRMGSPSKRPTP